MELKVGDRAPEFRASIENSTEVSLSDYAGKWLLLYFYPRDNTPGCTREACNLRDNYAILKEKGVEVLGVSPNSAKSHTGFIEKYELPFSLLVDADNAVSTAYGAWGEKVRCGKVSVGMTRMSYLIDPQGQIAYVFDKVKPAEHAEQVLAVFEKL